jgi:hypothetical protein
MNERMMINPLIRELREAGLQWQQIADRVNSEFGLQLTPDACRKRNESFNPDTITIKVGNDEETTTYGDGTKERTLKSKESLNSLSNKDKLTRLGENANEVELVWYSEKKWEAQTPDGIETLYSVGYKVKPTKKEITPIDYLKVAQETFSKSIKPLTLPNRKENKSLNVDKLFEIPAVELHLGKLSWEGDTDQNYDQHIAKARFRKIILEIIKEQQIQKCGTAVYYIGNDFFNSEANSMTTAGTPQQNDIRWKKMFNVGLELQLEAIATLREHFNKVDVRLVAGNHDNATSFYLYMALMQRFIKDNVVSFSDNYKETQCYLFGKCAIFTNHGDPNLKRLMKSIPAEFYEEWGKSLHRELHLGHLHKEIVVDDDSGMITRRIGSPSGTDNWHYHERFIGSRQKHQLFIWHKEDGLLSTKYITFSNYEKEKVLIK